VVIRKKKVHPVFIRMNPFFLSDVLVTLHRVFNDNVSHKMKCPKDFAG